MLKKFLHTIQPIIRMPSRQFSIVRKTKYPFDFDGISDSEFDFHKYGKINNFTQEILGPDMQPGFKLAFASYCEALVDNDSDFIKENCEPRFARDAERRLASLKEDEYHIVGNGIDINNINLMYSHVSLYLGVSANRDLNKPASNYQINEIPFFELVKFKMYLQKDLSMFQSNLSMLPFVEVDVTYRSPLKLAVIDKAGKTLYGQNPTSTHVVRFASFREAGATSQKNSSMLEIASKFKSFLNNSAKDKNKIFHEILLGDNYSWKIVDVDHVMGGNPL